MHITKIQIVKLINDTHIKGTVTGSGQKWEIELPNETNYKKFISAIKKLSGNTISGFRTGYGAWIFRPGYVDMGDFCDKSSRWHY